MASLHVTKNDGSAAQYLSGSFRGSHSRALCEQLRFTSRTFYKAKYMVWYLLPVLLLQKLADIVYCPRIMYCACWEMNNVRISSCWSERQGRADLQRCAKLVLR